MFDLNKFLDQIGTQVAQIKGYNSLPELIQGKAAAEAARFTDRVNETKQTPPVNQPTPYTMEVLAEQGVFGLTKGQLLMLGGLGVLIAVVALRR